MARLTGIVATAFVAVALTACGSSDDTNTSVAETSRTCADFEGVSEVVATTMDCGEASETAEQWARVCGDPTKDCTFGGNDVECSAKSTSASTQEVKCADGDRQVWFVVTAGSHSPDGKYVSTADVRGQGTAFSSPVNVHIEGSRITWQARCNSAGVSNAEVTGVRLIIDEEKIASTAMGCEASAERQDEDLAAFFASDPYWSLHGLRLTLKSAPAAPEDIVEVGLQRDSPAPDS